MEKNSNLNIKGLQCDSCDWKDMDIELEDYAEWVNKPCPKCGANLLTEESYNSVISLKKATNFLNTMSEDDLKKFEEDFINNATSEEMNRAIEMLEGLGNMDIEENINEGMTINIDIDKEGKIKFNKSNEK